MSAKSQAESALSLFELRDENQRLEKENATLLGVCVCVCVCKNTV